MRLAVRSRPWIAGALAAAATLLSATAACDPFPEEPSPSVVGSYLTGVQVLGDAGARHESVDQRLGAGSPDGPLARVAASATVVNGGSIRQAVTSDRPFRVVRVAVEEITVPAAAPGTGASPRPAPAVTSTGAPASGYQQITLSKSTAEAAIVLTFAQDLPSQRFVLYVAVADTAGAQGLLAPQDVQAVRVGTGNVQVSVSWDVDSDLDLHVIDPTGAEIYYGATTSGSGGRLDLDSNLDCYIDGVRNENVTWTQAPPGLYMVLVDLYRACGNTPTNYVVTIQTAGQPTRTIPGTLTGDGDRGAEAGAIVATFLVPAG